MAIRDDATPVFSASTRADSAIIQFLTSRHTVARKNLSAVSVN